MEEFELVRMEREAPRGICRRAVLAIADYRMAEAGQLHANLILAAGFERQLDQRVVSPRSQDSIVSDRQHAAALDAMHPQRLALDKTVAQRSFGFCGRAFYDGKILLRDVLPILLKGCLQRPTS